ncbi:hypothetical protein G7Y89_g8353 [Cudoniella acicularis]|uniref:Uncharacterized protein n=1 Tax=Cudoniella acicularis TaxID=354080 RepID=A0A8H4RIU1_9HELO|nr:hypothetical protein G7Y89_g8353 [Cudoniella acicularis]
MPPNGKNGDQSKVSKCLDTIKAVGVAILWVGSLIVVLLLKTPYLLPWCLLIFIILICILLFVLSCLWKEHETVWYQQNPIYHLWSEVGACIAQSYHKIWSPPWLKMLTSFASRWMHFNLSAEFPHIDAPPSKPLKCARAFIIDLADRFNALAQRIRAVETMEAYAHNHEIDWPVDFDVGEPSEPTEFRAGTPFSVIMESDNENSDTDILTMVGSSTNSSPPTSATTSTADLNGLPTANKSQNKTKAKSRKTKAEPVMTIFNGGSSSFTLTPQTSTEKKTLANSTSTNELTMKKSDNDNNAISYLITTHIAKSMDDMENHQNQQLEMQRTIAAGMNTDAVAEFFANHNHADTNGAVLAKKTEVSMTPSSLADEKVEGASPSTPKTDNHDDEDENEKNDDEEWDMLEGEVKMAKSESESDIHERQPWPFRKEHPSGISLFGGQKRNKSALE